MYSPFPTIIFFSPLPPLLVFSVRYFEAMVQEWPDHVRNQIQTLNLAAVNYVHMNRCCHGCRIATYNMRRFNMYFIFSPFVRLLLASIHLLSYEILRKFAIIQWYVCLSHFDNTLLTQIQCQINASHLKTHAQTHLMYNMMNIHQLFECNECGSAKNCQRLLNGEYWAHIWSFHYLHDMKKVFTHRNNKQKVENII